MQVGVPKESRPGERRVAAVPATVETMLGWGWTVKIQAEAGTEAGFPDDVFAAAGAQIVPDAASAHDADLVLRVGPPSLEEVGLTKEGAALIGFLEPFVDADLVRALAARNLTSVAVEAIPRTTLAQAMDALSSQANLAGYAAVLMGAQASPKLLPMMVTAAGTIAPSKALILGVGVAGLQAIATARRLGAVVHAYDIRIETSEQVESLGAKFIEAPTAEADEGGYAREVQDDVQQRQFEALSPHVADSDLVVTTAQIPGKPAPLLITREMVATMHPGSVIVDMAAGTGGNVAGSEPDIVVDIDGVKIFGPTNLASFVPTDASRMYARNLIAFNERVRDDETGELAFDLDDEIIGGSTITHAGRVVNPRSRELLGMEDSSA